MLNTLFGGKLRLLSKYASAVIAALVLAAVIAGGSYALGYRIGAENPKEVIVTGITNIGDDDVRADFGVFWDAWKKLKEFHIRGKELQDPELVFGAVTGMVGSIGDPNTNFLKPDDSKKFNEDISGSFGGIGAEIGVKNDQLVIISPLKNSPAERAGLKAGDKILKIDQTDTAGMNVNDAVKNIRGPMGTEVTLTIFREGFGEAKPFAIVRETIRVPTVDLSMLPDGIAHIKLYSFNEAAPTAFYEEAVKTVLGNARGIVLDLRNNPGGFLEVAVDIAGWFLQKGEVVAMEKFRDEFKDRNRTFYARGNGTFRETPVVVLVNGGSASASEILAGALRDNRNAKLVGEKTFGKGTVQELYPLVGGSQLKVTVAEWVLPSGKSIDKNGLVPDTEAKLDAEGASAAKDPQLEKAIEILKAEMTKFAKSASGSL